MTTEQAIDLANQAKRHPHQRLDKLRATTSAADLAAGVTALAKSYSDLGASLSRMQKRLDHLEDAVAYLRDFDPGQPLRRFHS